jgi:hypothetical protein
LHSHQFRAALYEHLKRVTSLDLQEDLFKRFLGIDTLVVDDQNQIVGLNAGFVGQ